MTIQKEQETRLEVNEMRILTRGMKKKDRSRNDKKVKVCFCIAQYPVRWTAQSTLHFTPGRPVHSVQQLCTTTKSLTFPPPSIARYSFIQLSQQGRQWRERKNQIFKTVAKGDSNPYRAHLIASLAFYR